MEHKKHIVKQGDCISSIAYKHGMFPDTIWNDPKNSDLKQEREDPNVLKPRDELYIRDKVIKNVSGSTEQRHRFRRKGVPEKLRLQLLHHGKPRANLEYIIEVDGLSLDGETDEDGRLEHAIPPDAKLAKLIISEDEEYELDLGHLAPVEDEDGAMSRLANLGYMEEEEEEEEEEDDDDDADEEAFVAALEAFQLDQDLKITGELDEATRDKLLEVHGS